MITDKFIGGGRGVGVLEHPQLSRSRYSNRAVILIQQFYNTFTPQIKGIPDHR